MLPKSRQQAWIRGLPGFDKEGGIALEVLPFSAPTPGKHSLSVTLYGSSELVSDLASLSKQRTKFPKFSLTVRTDAKKELDNQFQMKDAVIDSIVPAKDLAGAQVMTVLFGSVSIKMALTANPGPPPNCPPVWPTGVNTGWIFGLPHEDTSGGTPIEISDFIPPHYNRRLIVTLGKPSSEIHELTHTPTPFQELILVLPNRVSQGYVEFKLWDVKTTTEVDEKVVNFESDMIECLTGGDGHLSDDQGI